ncbi:hypothetical protein D9757_004233 [Collybiopsis confluens]|uniref:RRM domain-containing protein n=1 Tax=Collybiopsis confluens TaxID=2823264 RepID=A0A8H5HU91_9AGAR|nr:hypothetical protein D9757_004233 [Collybiopsis confluens]
MVIHPARRTFFEHSEHRRPRALWRLAINIHLPPGYSPALSYRSPPISPAINMDQEYQLPPQESGPHPHPYLHEPLLYITNVPANVSDETLGMAFMTCAPFRPKIVRDTPSPTVSGTIEFKFLDKAEKALATLQSRPIPNPPGVPPGVPAVPLVLSPYPPTSPPTPLPPPSALPRLVKHLPMIFSDSSLFDIFRPYGALASVRFPTHFAPDTGIIEFWNEDDARIAEEAMHCSDVEGQNIAIQIYQPRRTASGSMSEFNTNAPTFVPTGSVYGFPNAAATYSPPRPHYSPRSPVSPLSQGAQFIHGPGQQVQLAPFSGPGSNSHSGLIDPCNLFCKNLDPEIDSNVLFSHFRQFGQIVSARVMRNENGESRGFGFVSFQAPDQAAAAMHGMNGATLGSKQVVVRLHEPKQLRQEKLAQRFGGGGNGHPRTASGATSPTASEGGDSYAAGWGSPSPRNRTLGLGGSPGGPPDRGRRGSGSYYTVRCRFVIPLISGAETLSQAALTGTLNLPMRYDDLASLSPVVRKEVLTGELSRRVKSLGTVANSDIDSIVDGLVNISLSEIVQAIEDPEKLVAQVGKLKSAQNLDLSSPDSKSHSPARSTSASQDSRLLDPNALAATASAPEHPSTPISVNASLSTPPRTSSPSGSVPPTSERNRMAAAVAKFENSPSEKQEQLTDLLMTLPKKDRALCLFNMEVLRAKLADARLVLESMEEEEEEANKTAAAALPPSTPQSKKTTSTAQGSPQTPELSSRGPSANSSPLPTTPAGAPTYTVAALSKLPAVEVLKVFKSSSVILPPGVTKADPLVVQATDEFIDGIMEKAPQTQKQLLGEKLFKVVKSFGIKGAPKVTVTLLDQEDLRSLAHLMNSYPAVLKDKAQAVRPLRGDLNGQWLHDRAPGSKIQNDDLQPRGPPEVSEQNTKLLVSNLHYEITPKDLTVRPTIILRIAEYDKGASGHLWTDWHAPNQSNNSPLPFFLGVDLKKIKYDRSGRSLGTALVFYETTVEAAKAKKTYDGVLAKGEVVLVCSPIPRSKTWSDTLLSQGQPMTITYDTSIPRQRRAVSAPHSLLSRIQKAPLADRLSSDDLQLRDSSGPGPVRSKASRGGGRGGNRGGGTRHSEPKINSPKQPKTAEELDKELDAFMGDADPATVDASAEGKVNGESTGGVTPTVAEQDVEMA